MMKDFSELVGERWTFTFSDGRTTHAKVLEMTPKDWIEVVELTLPHNDWVETGEPYQINLTHVAQIKPFKMDLATGRIF